MFLNKESAIHQEYHKIQNIEFYITYFDNGDGKVFNSTEAVVSVDGCVCGIIMSNLHFKALRVAAGCLSRIEKGLDISEYATEFFLEKHISDSCETMKFEKTEHGWRAFIQSNNTLLTDYSGNFNVEAIRELANVLEDGHFIAESKAAKAFSA